MLRFGSLRVDVASMSDPVATTFDGPAEDPYSDRVSGGMATADSEPQPQPQIADEALPSGFLEGHKRLLFVCSSGGHLSQLLQLRPWWVHHQRRWVTFDLPDAQSKLQDETLIPAYHPTTRNIVNMARNGHLAQQVLRSWKPDVVISNGAGVAFPFFMAARARRIPTVYLEVYDRIDSRTLTGRLCEPFTDRFLVQWPEQQALYADSQLVGPLY